MTTVEELVESHLESARRMAERWANTRRRGLTADDLFSDAMYGLLRAARAYRGGPFEPLADTAVRNAMRDGLRRWSRWHRDLVDGEFDRPAPVGADPYLLAWVRSGLGWRERVLLVLVYQEGMTLQEAAQCLGMTKGRASALRRQALDRARGMAA